MWLYHLLWLFFCYSFLGWVGETTLAAIRQKRYVDRSVLYGPLCVIYGVTGVIIHVVLSELAAGDTFFLFLFAAVWATVVEWAAGHILEWATHTRWWDYSDRKWNLDGYICLSASALWGLLGVAAVRWVGPLLLRLYGLLPTAVGKAILWVLVGLLAVDTVGTVLTLSGLSGHLPRVEAVNSRLAGLSVRMGLWILGRTEGRIRKAYPEARFAHPKAKEKPTVFAQGCSFYKIALLFIVGAFLGDLTETIFCRITAGVWMSRSSVVWGHFSIVWGLAMALATWFLYRYKDRSPSFLFVAGTLLGGAYEYLCSVFTEIVFGAVFWDYSHLPFNLGGRINLLYCFFWGFAAVAWFRVVYPVLSGWIEKIPQNLGPAVTWVLLIFMTCNIAVSGLALVRYDTRTKGEPADSGWEIWVDEHFPDSRMARIYPNLAHKDDLKLGK